MLAICYFSNLLFNRVLHIPTQSLAMRTTECSKNFLGFSFIILLLLLLFYMNAESYTMLYFNKCVITQHKTFKIQFDL